MREYRLDVEINAPVKDVWDALLDFENYSKWNPIVQSISGSFAEGESIKHTLLKVNGQKVLYTPIVLKVDAPFRSVLAKSLIHPKFAYLKHYFELEKLSENTTNLKQRWECTGLAVPLMWKGFIKRFENFEKSNAGFKRYLEKRREQSA